MKVIGVQFLTGLKVYDFMAGDKEVKVRDYVLVDTTQGEEVGKVVYINKNIKNKETQTPTKEIIKVLTEEDKEKLREMRKESKTHLEKFKEKIEMYNLKMKPVMVDYSLDGEKMTFFFSADGRVDFRRLVKDLAYTFNRQIIMRQIGARDEAKIYGGFGMCGRPVCCKGFLFTSEAITMDMARKQYSVNVNASKVSGMCGRLMCCLAFEKQNKTGIAKGLSKRKRKK